MSKKSCTFALEMEKRQYIYPKVEVVQVGVPYLMQFATSDPHANNAPRRRTADVF